MDSISLLALQQLPLVAWEPIAHILTSVKNGRTWPRALLGVGPPVPGAEQSEAAPLKVSGLLAVLRPFDALRYSDLLGCARRMDPKVITALSSCYGHDVRS